MGKIVVPLFLIGLFCSVLPPLSAALDLAQLDSMWQTQITSRPQLSDTQINAFFSQLLEPRYHTGEDTFFLFTERVFQWADQQDAVLRSKIYVMGAEFWAEHRWNKYSTRIINYLEKAFQSVEKADLPDQQLELLSRLIHFYSQMLSLYEQAYIYVKKAEALCYDPASREQITRLPRHLFRIADYYYQIRRYDKAVGHFEELLALPDLEADPTVAIKSYNNLGLCYAGLKQYEAAIAIYEKGKRFAQTHEFHQHEAWVGIITGNIGGVYDDMGQREKAIPFLQFDIDNSLRTSEHMSAYFALKSLAKIYLQQGEVAKAEKLLLVADSLQQNTYLQNWQDLVSTDSLWSVYYKETQQWAKSVQARERYSKLRDSILRYTRRNELDKIQMQQQFLEEKSALEMQLHQARLRQQLSVIGFITAIFLFIGALLYALHRSRRIKSQMEDYQKRRDAPNGSPEMERIGVHKKMGKPQADYTLDQSMEPTAARIAELTRFTVLTEADWERFKNLFEEVYGDFLTTVTQKGVPLTPAEIRLLAFLKLGLNNREMAASLAVSPDTVKKYKQRLRGKLKKYAGFSIDGLIRASQ